MPLGEFTKLFCKLLNSCKNNPAACLLTKSLLELIAAIHLNDSVVTNEFLGIKELNGKLVIKI